MGIQPLENKALSWGTIRKSASILAAITIRKSQGLLIFSWRHDLGLRALRHPRCPDLGQEVDIEFIEGFV